MSAFERLISQIDAFIRKFYKNQLIKGLILFAGVFVLSYLCVITLEYFGRFNSVVRGALFFTFLAGNGYIFGKYIVLPTLKLKSYGNKINRYQASQIIGKFFPAISDRLLNTLQLSDQMNQDSADYELINASVQQRSATMSTMPFVDAININENKRYLTWVLPLIFLLMSLWVFVPSFINSGTERVINFSETFELPPPFKYDVKFASSQIEEGEDFHFIATLSGEELPQKVYVRSPKGLFLLSRVAKNKFEGVIPQVRNDLSFHLISNNYKSNEYAIEVIAKTALGKFQATLVYPPYLGKSNEVIENASDLTINEGTVVRWSVLTKNSEGVEFWVNKDKKTFKEKGFVFEKKFVADAKARIVLSNAQTAKKDTTFFDVNVIRDEHPSIQVDEEKDSIKEGVRYFNGVVGDDYGLRSLSFVYTIKTKNGKERTERLPVSRVFGTETLFNFAVDLRGENLNLEDVVEYYFIVNDNDGVNGSKSTRSRRFEYRLPTLEELNETRNEEQENIKKDLSEILEKTDKFKKDLERLKKETLNSSKSDWNKQNQVQQLQEDHNSLLEDLESLQEEMNNSVEEKNELSEMDQDLLEQQEMINDLLEELMDEEMKDLLKQLEDLMKKQDKNKLEENLENIEMSSEDMKKQLDRSLEMLKRLQVNEKIDDIEEELKKLAEKQDELRKETENKKDVSEEQKKEQEEINKDFEDLKEDMEELDSLNKELKSPMELDPQEEKGDEVSEDLKDSKEQLDKEKTKKAGESQKGASDKMKEMAENLAAMQANSNQKKQQEDIDTLRNILEGLLILSIEQESNMGDFRKVSEQDPAYRRHGREQRKIINSTRVIRDSLLALAERQPKIAKFIDKELRQIKVNHELILEEIDERKRKELLNHQQYVMTSFNNLALMLNESLEQMQQQMQSMMQGSGSCNNPGGKGQPKPGEGSSGEDMKEMLKKQLEQMKKGSNPGGEKPGDKPGSKGGGQGSLGLSNKQVAKMAAEQSAMRRKLEQMRGELNKAGKGEGNRLDPLIRELEEQERDLVNKRLGNNIVDRQKRILTRLLESEKALMQRGLDEKRESKEGKFENNSNLIRFDEYNKEKLKQIELLRSVDPAYKKYYKDRANEYFNRVL